MAKWYTISAKFTSEEKRILDILRDVYGLSHNQSLRGGVELFARILAMSEYYVMSDSKIMKKVSRIGKKSMKQMDADVKKILENIPLKQQEAEYEKFSNDSTKILSNFDKVFVKKRKKGRTPKKRSNATLSNLIFTPKCAQNIAHFCSQFRDGSKKEIKF